jgi:hypothetical protein
LVRRSRGTHGPPGAAFVERARQHTARGGDLRDDCAVRREKPAAIVRSIVQTIAQTMRTVLAPVFRISGNDMEPSWSVHAFILLKPRSRTRSPFRS